MASSTKPILSVRPHDRAVLAAVDSVDLDHDTTLKLQDELTTALDAAPSLPLVLDVARVDYMPSLALGFLVKVHKSLVQAGRGCVLVGVRPRVLEVMAVAGLTKFLVLRDTTEEALQAL